MISQAALIAIPLHAAPSDPEDSPPGDSGGRTEHSAEARIVESTGVAEAREAFLLGSALAKQGRWADALAQFQSSASRKPHPVTTYNIAYCERALGRPARAYARFAEALESAGSPDSASLPEAVATRARLYLLEAERRVARVRIHLRESNVTLRVDGRGLELLRESPDGGIFTVSEPEQTPSAPPRSFSLWVDPGTRVFEVTDAAGNRNVESHTFGEGTHTELSLSIAAQTPADPAPLPAIGPADTLGAEHPGSPDRLPAFLAFGIGAAGLITGSVFAGLALKEKSALDEDPRCKNRRCPDEASYRDQQARMRRFADSATVSVAVGVAGAAVGTYLWLTAKPAQATSRTSSRIEPWIGGRTAGLSGTF